MLYIAETTEWETHCEKMLAAGFSRVESFNPYWESAGASFADHDGYRVVLQNRAWPTTAVVS